MDLLKKGQLIYQIGDKSHLRCCKSRHQYSYELISFVSPCSFDDATVFAIFHIRWYYSRKKSCSNWDKTLQRLKESWPISWIVPPSPVIVAHEGLDWNPPKPNMYIILVVTRQLHPGARQVFLTQPNQLWSCLYGTLPRTRPGRWLGLTKN